MRGFYVTVQIFLFFISFSVTAQDLINSRRSSYYTFIYRIDNDQAKVLYKDVWDIDNSFLKNLIGFYPTDSIYKNKLTVGHYVFIKTVNGNLNCEVKSVNNLSMKLLNNHRDLILIFNDSIGKELSNLKIEVGTKRIPFEKELKSYRLPKSNKRGVISATYQGHVSYFKIDRRFNNTFFVRTGKKISRTFPINYIISPFYYLANNIRSVVNGGRITAPGIYHSVAGIFKPKPHTGYIVFNKPKFKQDDTLRLKGFVTKRNGKPIGKTVNIYLNKYYPDPFSKKIATITPFRQGAYQYELKLSDSLELSLDNSYSVEFRDKKGHSLLSSNFRYEDYELKQNTYSVRSETKSKLKPATLYLKGEDSNEMPLYDIRVEILLRPKDVKKYYESRLFIPDTLWFHQTKLDPIGETKISIPDSVMPNTSLSYEAIVTFSNTENERVVKTVSVDNNKKPFPINIELENDSLKISSLNPQNPVLDKVKFSSSDQEYDFTEKLISLPYAEKVNYFADWYSVSYKNGVGTEMEGIDLEEQADKLQILANRTTDSIIVVTDNIRKIPFRYFLFRNQSLIQSSETEYLLIKQKAKASDSYTLSVQYIWAGKSETKEYEIGFDKKNLDIKLEHPAIIYPGQKASFKITVQDAFGKPVENADLTAYAITKKFESQSVPSLPSFSKPKPKRLIFNEFNDEEIDLTVSKTIDWAYWRKTLGLDSIAFYKFLFPDSGYFDYRVKSETAQFAPFVVSRGSVIPIQVIYLDGQPIYYKGATTVEPYSFPATAGEHKVSLRLWSGLLTIEKVKIEAGQKVIFSIDRNHLPANCSEIKMPYKFTDEELIKLSRYFILIKSEPSQADAYVQQGNTYRVLDNQNNYYGYSSYGKLAGPFYPGKTTYAQKDGFNLTFDYEPFFAYEFKEGILKLHKTDIGNQLKGGFSWQSATPSFKDQVQTFGRIKEDWKHQDENSTPSFQRFPDFEPTSKLVGRLTLEGLPKDASQLVIRATFIVDLNNPDNYYVFPKTVRNLPFYPGNYQAILIFNNEQYLKADSIQIKAYGSNYYNLESYRLHNPDSFSSKVLEIIKKWSVRENYNTRDRQLELQRMRELYYKESSSNYFFGNTVTGRIVSKEDGSPLPGVNVIVKGTAIGTVTDIDGYYSINCSTNATLVFSFIGLKTEEALVNSKSNVDVKLENDVQHLDEVVVVGYGLQRRSNLTASVSTVLNGRVAGIVVRSPRFRGDFEDSVSIKIRGLVSSQSDTEPLVILDGKIVRLQDIDKTLITAIETLKGSEAVALYGSRASNGVILVSTRPGATKEYLHQFSKSIVNVATLESTPGNTLRKNFRDYAFWKPSLKTDQDGKAEFDATFPDDITGWNAYVLGMASKKRTGRTNSAIQSYKPLLAQIAQPHFLIHGDTSTAIGKITNYGNEEIQLDRVIKVNDLGVSKSSLVVKDSKIDSILLTGEGTDSLSVFYSVTYKTYSDGELRKIPVYPQGVKEAIGEFVSLTTDTTVTLHFDKGLGKVKLYAQADLIDVFIEEINYLKNYPYECNEQLASKLWALLLEKKINAYKNEKFKNEREAQKMIKKLVSHQNSDGSWSWWGTGEGNVWITLHIARCFSLAQKEGFNVAFNKESLINYLEGSLANLSSNNKLEVFAYLLEQGEKIRVKELTDSLKKSKTASIHDKLITQRLLQLSGQSPDWTWINSVKSKTVKGNLYWGEEQLDISDNSVINTLLVYKMMEKENPTNKELLKIQNYFLEKRKRNWRNTYESSLILETLLPRLISEKQADSRPKLQLSGVANQTVEQFPFEQVTSGEGTLTISKSGQSPVYFSAYQENWNANPTRVEKDFVVSTSFDDAPKILKAGKPIKLNVTVEVKKDAGYVMIEVPIPAGCSYESKPQVRSNGEVHREYFNYKTNIYCQYLKKGTYTYSISLLPRYSGNYTLNPTVAQCMYFPVVYGREGMRKVRIN